VWGAYGRLFMAAARFRSLGAPLTMRVCMMFWYWAFMVLFIIMRLFRCSFCIWARFCRVCQYPSRRPMPRRGRARDKLTRVCWMYEVFFVGLFTRVLVAW
jgi:hypothetical protein